MLVRRNEERAERVAVFQFWLHWVVKNGFKACCRPAERSRTPVTKPFQVSESPCNNGERRSLLFLNRYLLFIFCSLCVYLVVHFGVVRARVRAIGSPPTN